MQIESLTEERLNTLREMFRAEKDEAKRAEITAEGKLIKAYLENHKWGSKENGGNGYCYTCHNQLARVGHYNCLQCAGVEKVNYQSRTLQGMQQTLLEWSKHTPKNSLEKFHQKNVEDAFQIKFQEP